MIETLPATRIRAADCTAHFSEYGVSYQAVMTLCARILKKFSSIRLSFLPDAQHHGKYFALRVEPGMFVIMGFLQRF